MKFSINSMYKIWITIMLAIVVLGFTVFGIFGFNQTIDYKNSHEAVVSMDTQLEITPEKLGETAQAYFDAKGISPVSYATQEIDGPIGKYSIIYKFDKDVNLNTTEMEQYVTAKVGSQSIVITVDYNDNVSAFSNSQVGWIVLALGLTALAMFIYLFFMEKLASALSVLCSSVFASIMFIALLAGCRVPAYPFAGLACATAFVLATILGSGMVNRFKEEIRINDTIEQSKDRLTFVEIADKSACASLLRFIFAFAGVVLVSAIMIALGGAYVKFLGIQFLIAGVSAVFSSFIGIPLLWPILKKIKK